jgi:hypothetical protein
MPRRCRILFTGLPHHIAQIGKRNGSIILCSKVFYGQGLSEGTTGDDSAIAGRSVGAVAVAVLLSLDSWACDLNEIRHV